LYIEEHLNYDINLEAAARAGFTSLMQLYRHFYTYTGHSVKEYIRKRRLSNALHMIKFTDMPLAEIAYSCGYSSQQALCKYVKAATTMTALTYKKSENYYYFPMLSVESLRQVTVATETIPKTICLKFYHTQLRGIENRAINALLMHIPEYKGRIFGSNGRQLGNKFCYELLIEYDSESLDKLKSSVFVEPNLLPDVTLTFAKTTVKNEDDEIGLAWDYIYTNWLKTSMFVQDDKNFFEEYLHKDRQVKKLILYLPVKKRMDYNKISMKTCQEQVFLVASRKGYNAEENASQSVMNFLSQHYPSVIRTAHQFYLEKNSTHCTCGIRLEKPLDLPLCSELEILHIPKGNYAILESDCCSDSSLFESLLLSWINENHFIKNPSPSFTIYETNGNFKPESIRMEIYIMLKNDNTQTII
jgi:AraC-like DNA-binding protein/predicted transcriptional regulator YdeE